MVTNRRDHGGVMDDVFKYFSRCRHRGKFRFCGCNCWCECRGDIILMSSNPEPNTPGERTNFVRIIDPIKVTDFSHARAVLALGLPEHLAHLRGLSSGRLLGLSLGLGLAEEWG